MIFAFRDERLNSGWPALGRSGVRALVALFGIWFAVGGLASCQRSTPGGTTPASFPSAKPDARAWIQRGRAVYQTQCTACHNTNPHRPGSLGPDVFGSSRELLEARIVRGSYPAGYTPKRETHVMAPLPHLKNELDAIHAYLNAVE